MRFSSAWRRGGLTLLEVVVAIVLLGTLLVGVMLATGQHLRQMRAVDQRRQATEVADQMLAQWLKEPQRIAAPATGKASDDFTWRCSEVPNLQASHLGIRIVRLEIMAAMPLANEKQAPLAVFDIAVARPVDSMGAGNE